MAETESFRRSRIAFYNAQVRKGLLGPEEVPIGYRKRVCKYCRDAMEGSRTVCKKCMSEQAQIRYWNRRKREDEDEAIARAERMTRVGSLIADIKNHGPAIRPTDSSFPISMAILKALHKKPQRRNFRYFKRPGYCEVCDVSVTGRFGCGDKYRCRDHVRKQTPQSKTG